MDLLVVVEHQEAGNLQPLQTGVKGKSKTTIHLTSMFGEIHMMRYSLLLAVVFFSWGCAQVPFDLRSALLTAAKAGDPDFPDGRSVQSTHFSHVCEINTDCSERIYVADHRTVLLGMILLLVLAVPAVLCAFFLLVFIISGSQWK